MHAPSRVTALPVDPALPPHRIDLCAAYHILPPLRIDGVHALPRSRRQHILCHAVRSTLPKAVQTDYIGAIEESDVDLAKRGRRRTRQYFPHNGAADDTGVSAKFIIFERNLKPALGLECSPFWRTRRGNARFVKVT